LKRLAWLLMGYSIIFSIVGIALLGLAWGQPEGKYFTWLVSGGSSVTAVGLTTFVNAMIVELSYQL